MIAEYITLILLFVATGFSAYYFARYIGWKYPEYHQEDNAKTYAWASLACCLLVILVVEMAAT